jgi:hypothetical protein
VGAWMVVALHQSGDNCSRCCVTRMPASRNISSISSGTAFISSSSACVIFLASLKPFCK